MHASVAAAWPKFCERWEGRLAYMYLDVKAKVTTGTGNLIDSVGAAQALPWLKADGARATPAEIEAEWRRIKARTDLAPKSGYAFAKVATLHLDAATLDRLLVDKSAEFWTRLAQSVPQLEAWPADAQLAALDTAWQNGPAFLDLKSSSGGYVWAGTRAALLGQDFAAAATHVPGTGARADARKRLYRNAATVAALKLDRAVLWNEATPTAPPTPPAPPKETVMHSTTWHADYVRWRGVNLAPVSRDACLAIPSSAVPSQGGLSTSVRASANTHAGIGAYDLKVAGWSKAKILALCAELIRSGEAAFPRGGWFGSAMFSTHVHVVSTNVPRSALHPEARAQLDDFRAKPRRNGLAGHGRYVGPSTPLGSWSTSPYNPANVREERGVMYVQSATLLGLDVDRNTKEHKRRGDRVAYVRKVKRWGRWNVVTVRGRYFAISDKSQTYLAPKIPTK